MSTMSTRSNTTSGTKKELWIGEAHVKQPNRDGVLGDADQAYVNAIALAVDRSDLRSQIKQALKELDLELIRLQDAEPLAVRRSKYSIDPSLVGIAKDVKQTGSPRFSTFHAYKKR